MDDKMDKNDRQHFIGIPGMQKFTIDASKKEEKR